jgi:hypothetical protein
VAVRVTTVLMGKLNEQVEGQEMPVGELATAPDPEIVTVSGSVASAVNVAVTAVEDVIAMTQVPVPEHPAPAQPVNVYPESGEAVRVTLVPPENVAEHADGQEMPVGELITFPDPITVAVRV